MTKKLIAAPALPVSPVSMWSLYNLPTRVFGWTELLREWSMSAVQPVQVYRVLENLKTHQYPITHFLQYLNNEQDGILWLLFEIVSWRTSTSNGNWFWEGTPRLEYVKELLDHVENLDAGFPDFPGSPRGHSTVRQFIVANLNGSQLAEVNMMPPLLRTPPPVQRTLWPQGNTSNYYPAQGNTSNYYSTQGNAQCGSCSMDDDEDTYAKFVIRVVRKDTPKSGSQDDILTIQKVDHDTYDLFYTDKYSNVRTVTRSMDRAAILNNISIVLRSLQTDDDPFAFVQVLPPNMPTIMVNIENLYSQNRDLIYDSIESTMNNWPLVRD